MINKPAPPPSAEYCPTCKKWVEPISGESDAYRTRKGTVVAMDGAELCPICGGEVDRYEVKP